MSTGDGSIFSDSIQPTNSQRRQGVLSRALSLLREVQCPDYLANVVSPVDCGRPRCGLPSSSSSDFSLPRLRTKLGERAFTYASPSAWNSLPKDLRAVTDPELFRKRLKTHFFSLAFCVCWQFGWLCNASMTYKCNRRTINPRMMMMMMMLMMMMMTIPHRTYTTNS